MKSFEPHPQAEERRRSAALLIELLLAADDPKMMVLHRRELIGILLWKLTEADGKYNTKYQSLDALKCMDASKLRHDHVYTRKKIIDALLQGAPEKRQQSLEAAVGCTVTVEEHTILSRFDEACDGWSRYVKAKVIVMNVETGKSHDLVDLI